MSLSGSGKAGDFLVMPRPFLRTVDIYVLRRAAGLDWGAFRWMDGKEDLFFSAARPEVRTAPSDIEEIGACFGRVAGVNTE